ncbi:MAG: hypothetical protein P8P81_02300 [Bacteroidia bacterium]|nr:hypothetical protein [Bacteroidia bacterium]
MKTIDSIMKHTNTLQHSIKQHHLLFVLMLLLLSIFLTNCGPDERTTLYIDQKTKDYVVFHPGSWWAYQEHSSSAVDTVSVIGYQSAIEFWEDFASENFELTRLSLKWSSFGHDLTKANPFLLIWANDKIAYKKS